jgi:hypothetical protein
VKLKDVNSAAAALDQAAEVARLLDGLQLTEAADRVREAVILAAADPVRASQMLAEAAALVAARAPETR